MEVIIFLILIISTYAFWAFNRTRCPKCGYKGLNKKNFKLIKEMTENEFEKKLYNDLYKKADAGVKPLLYRNTFWQQPLMCNRCKHTFNRNKATTWHKIAISSGEDIAIKDYNEINKNRDA